MLNAARKLPLTVFGMETRQAPRRNVTLPGRYITGLGLPVDVTLIDISEGGCCFSSDEERLRIGTPLQMYIAGSGPHRGSVRWTHGNEVGIAFLIPLDEQTLDQIQSGEIDDRPQPVAPVALEQVTEAQPLRFC